MRWCLSAGVVGVCMLAAVGCRYTTRSGLPEHIKTVEIPNFRNKTFYHGLEGKLARALARWANQQPQVRVVNTNGDARISGEIIKVEKRTVRENASDRPASQHLTIRVRYSFEDNTKQEALIKDKEITNQMTSSSAGLYDLDRGEGQQSAEDAAVDAIARDIVSETIGMW